jgi:hypothetical protein
MFGVLRKYKKRRQLLNKLNLQKAALAKKNQQVFISDLVVKVEPPYHCGEYNGEHTNPYQNIPENERLIDHIKTLFTLANEDHRNHYCSEENKGKFKLKPGKENCITRLTTHF